MCRYSAGVRVVRAAGLMLGLPAFPGSDWNDPPLPLCRGLRGPWRTILLSGALAIAITVVMQPLFVLALLGVRDHTDLDAVRSHVRQSLRSGRARRRIDAPERFIHRGGHQFTECIGHVVLLDRQADLARTAISPAGA